MMKMLETLLVCATRYGRPGRREVYACCTRLIPLKSTKVLFANDGSKKVLFSNYGNMVYSR